MDSKKLQNIISQGEGITVEYKKANKKLPDNLFETICAFLNRNGGEILLGVDDDKNVHGVDENVVEQLTKQIVNLSNNPQKLFPSFLLEPKIVEIKGKKLIYIFVSVSSQVHNTAGKIYDRSADGDFVLKSDEQIKQLYNRKSLEYSENKIYPFLDENDFEEEVIERTRKIIRIYRPDHPWNELTNIEFYKTAGLYRKDIFTGQEGFTMSALLLFGKDEIIQSAIPHYKVDALLRKVNLDRYDDRDNIRCNLIEAYDRLMSFVAKHLPDKFYLHGDQRISLREKIFREVIANMLIHREYTNAYPSSFIIYDDRVETKNANKPHLIKELIPGNFEPFPKNPHIAQIFTLMGRSEELGTGVQNVYKYSKAYSGSDNIIFKEADVFVARIPLKKSIYVTDVSGGVNGGVKKLYEIIKTNPNKRTNELAKLMNIPNKTLEKWIAKLRKANKIEFKGSSKTGGYFVKKTNNENELE